MAYRIIALGPDPDGAGSDLPSVIIHVEDPSGIDLALVHLVGSGTGGLGGGGLRLVQ